MSAPRIDMPDGAAMITREGRVVSVSADHVVVRFERESACAACRAAKVCAGNTPTQDLVLDRPHSRRLVPGDVLRVGVPEASALRATATAYLTPLAGLLLGMVAAVLAGLPEALVVTASFAGLGAGLLAMRRLARRPASALTPTLLDSSESKT